MQLKTAFPETMDNPIKTYESGNGKLHSEKQANGSGKEYV